MVLSAYMVPHPPIIIPDVGRGEQAKIQATTEAFIKVAEDINTLAPDVIIIISPHTTIYYDYFHISPGLSARGDLSKFGAASISMNVTYDTQFVETLSEAAEKHGIPAGTLGEKDSSLDHGTLIPVYFVDKLYRGCTFVRVGISGMDPLMHYKMGKAIAEASEKLDKRVIVVASGDLSHKLKADGPYGFAPEGPEFDKQVTQAAASGDFLSLMELDQNLANNAAECGLRSFIMMAGTLDGKAVTSELLSYEGPFGVGYAVAMFHVTGDDPMRCFDKAFVQHEQGQLADIRSKEDEYTRFARQAVEHYVSKGRNIPLPDDLPMEMTSKRAGVFVSIKKRGELRGCIGTIQPVTNHIADEIIRNARSAAAEDPRFPAITADELDTLTYSVDIMGSPEPATIADLDPQKYGVIVTSGHKRGLLLPNLDGVNSVEQQVRIAKEKAGITPAEACTLERFEVVRHQ